MTVAVLEEGERGRDSHHNPEPEESERNWLIKSWREV